MIPNRVTRHLWGMGVAFALTLLAPPLSAASPAAAAPRGGAEKAAAKTPREAPAFQQEPQQVRLPPQDKEYVETTSEEKQNEADKVFQQGNRRFEKRQLDDAIRLYRKAYTLWPHPIILFNMAINLGFLSNPLGAARMFRKVLEYKPGPITQERYDEAALNYQKLMKQLSTLRVVCQEPGAEVFVDGKSYGAAPLDTTITVTPGRHMVAARLKDKVPYSAEIHLKAGYHGELTLVMQAFMDVVRTRVVPRYHWWVPTLASVVAAVAVSAGAGLWADGRSSISDLRQAQLAALSEAGNYPIQYDQPEERRAKGLQIGGQVMVGLAVTAVAAAVTLWVLRKKRESYTVEMQTSPGGGGVNLSF